MKAAFTRSSRSSLLWWMVAARNSCVERRQQDQVSSAMKDRAVAALLQVSKLSPVDNKGRRRLAATSP